MLSDWLHLVSGSGAAMSFQTAFQALSGEFAACTDLQREGDPGHDEGPRTPCLTAAQERPTPYLAWSHARERAEDIPQAQDVSRPGHRMSCAASGFSARPQIAAEIRRASDERLWLPQGGSLALAGPCQHRGQRRVNALPRLGAGLLVGKGASYFAESHSERGPATLRAHLRAA